MERGARPESSSPSESDPARVKGRDDYSHTGIYNTIVCE